MPSSACRDLGRNYNFREDAPVVPGSGGGTDPIYRAVTGS